MLWFLYFLLRQVPRRVRTLCSFNAADPWNEGRQTEFTIEGYVMVPKTTAKNVNLGRMYGKPPVLAVKSELDGRERFVPEFLTDLYKAKKVQAEELPALMYEIEPHLKKSDYKLRRRGAKAWLFGMVVPFALFTLGALAMYYATVMSQPNAHAAEKDVSQRAWLADPWAEEGIHVNGMTKMATYVTTSAPLHVAADANAYGTEKGFSLGVMQGAKGPFLVLISNDRRVFTPYGIPFQGIVVKPADIGLSGDALADLQKQVPGLDTSHVLCLDWRWRQIRLNGEWKFFAAAFGIILALTLLIGLPIFLPALLRHRRHTAWALKYMGEPVHA